MLPEKVAELAIAALKDEYPEAKCSLVYESAFQLLVATRLAAQCTDARVNLVAPALFAKFPDVQRMAEADVLAVEKIIHSCGFFRTKARDLVALSQKILSDFGGEVPNNMDALLSLPGVGRKTANLILGDIYKKPATVIDTHCARITRRLGLQTEKAPEKIESALGKLLPPEESNDFCHRLVLHGRAVCKAQKPNCTACCMAHFCKFSPYSFK